MTEIVTNSANRYPIVQPVVPMPNEQSQQSSVAITTPNGRQVYQYPQTSVYKTPDKQQGLNIYVFNPSGLGAPSTFTNNNYGGQTPMASSPLANTPLHSQYNQDTKNTDGKKTKNVVKLTNEYIKSLESFLRSHDSAVRKQGIQDLIKRFEEDEERYDNPSLTALLNIALQDPDVHNRMIATSLIASGGAHGDNNTVQLLTNLTNSDKMYGQEAEMASKALLNTTHTREKIIDNSSKEQKEGNS